MRMQGWQDGRRRAIFELMLACKPADGTGTFGDASAVPNHCVTFQLYTEQLYIEGANKGYSGSEQYIGQSRQPFFAARFVHHHSEMLGCMLAQQRRVIGFQPFNG